jgi:nitrogen fixation protein NifB
MSIRVAFATSPGGAQLEHFGHAEQFAIYEFSGELPVSQEVRQAEAFCQRSGKQTKLEAVADMLADCKAVVCAAIGPCARQELSGADVLAYEFDGSIEDAIQTIARHPEFVRRAQTYRQVEEQ